MDYENGEKIGFNFQRAGSWCNWLMRFCQPLTGSPNAQRALFRGISSIRQRFALFFTETWVVSTKKTTIDLQTSRRFFPTRFLPTPLGAKIETAGGDPKNTPLYWSVVFFFSLSLSLLKLVRSHSWGWSLPLKRRSYTFGKLTWQTWTTLHLFLKNGWISKPAMCAWSNLHSNKKSTR